ncbi:hypothetical protein [Rhodohalobacter sulfatireducens]|uniref:Uncharacterized protein n=1 Tax=Rhodohalobacter sulfatireducens TaxID=2911366 RepID=A0ABS9KA88_9BACT|nr:hypothetical protein [Rhodohalobacter sulfatireducens]MCG2587762.1 hypothetical protein [Rhodohalobacter sulfatireducens]
MNDFPLVEMLAFFTRFETKPDADWRLPYRRDLQRVRSCHCKEKGGVRKSYYTIDTKQGERFDLVFNEQELLWSLDKSTGYEDKAIDRVLALVDRHKHKPSRAHRVIPYRFELLPEELAKKTYDGTEKPLIHRMQPYRFRSGKIPSTQVFGIPTIHMENTMITKELNYVVETDQHRFFHLVYILDEMDWRFMQEVDEEFFFVR